MQSFYSPHLVGSGVFWFSVSPTPSVVSHYYGVVLLLWWKLWKTKGKTKLAQNRQKKREREVQGVRRGKGEGNRSAWETEWERPCFFFLHIPIKCVSDGRGRVGILIVVCAMTGWIQRFLDSSYHSHRLGLQFVSTDTKTKDRERERVSFVCMSSKETTMKSAITPASLQLSAPPPPRIPSFKHVLVMTDKEVWYANKCW